MKNRSIKLAPFILTLAFSCSLASTLTVPNKYVAGVSPLRTDHDYIQKHPAPTYWKVSPFYIAQRNEASCSIASATIMVNSARNLNPILANEALATQDSVLEKVNDATWTKGVAPDGVGASLDQLSEYLPIALKRYGVNDFSIKTFHVENTKAESLKALRDELTQLEAGKTFMLINFELKFFTNIDSGGHISPIAAYDAEKKRALIMDVYRYKFEPYWVPDTLLLESMATQDMDVKKKRGYMVILIK